MRTLLEHKAAGLTSVQLRCVECKAAFQMSTSALNFPDLTLLGDIWALRPIACPNCSAPALIIPPDLSTKEEDRGESAAAIHKDEGAR